MEVDCSKISEFVDTLIHCDTLDECFSGFIKNTTESETFSKKALEEKAFKIFENIPKESNNIITEFYIHSISNIINYNQSQLLFSIIEHLIHKDVIDSRNVCSYILSSKNFDFSNEVFWVNGLSFIHRILHFVKYKGVRDILVILLAKIPLIPLKSSVAAYKQINSLHNLIQYIFDRNSALLPAYLVLDEIQKKSIAWQNGHWKFSKLICSFVDSFKPVAEMVSISGRTRVLPIVGKFFPINSLKLDHMTAKYKLKGLLPYDKELNEPQFKLLLKIIEQNNSRETIVNVLSLNKIEGRNEIIEKLLTDLILNAIKQTHTNQAFIENDNFQNIDLNETDNDLSPLIFYWHHISTTFDFLYKNIHFSIFLNTLYDKISEEYSNPVSIKFLLKSREFLMWTFFQVLSGYVQKHAPVDTFKPILRFIDLLYPEKEPIQLPDFSKVNSIYIMSAASTWILLNDLIKFQKQTPPAIKLHVNFIQEIITNNSLNSPSDYLIILLCNSYSANNECFSKIFHFFIENVLGKRIANTSGNPNQSTQQPISMNLLDSMNVHTKKSLLSHIINQFMTLAQTKSPHCFPSALAETYSRLLVYSEIEAFGINTLINQLLCAVLRNHCWDRLYSLLELFSFRLHHINCANQIQLLRQLYNKSNISQINHVQLYSCIESTALKIILGFNSSEFIQFYTPIQPRITGESYNFLPSDSEELNKVFVLTLARAIHITGTETLSGDKYTTWVNDILTDIKQNLNTNLNWPAFTLQCFPSVISKFYQQNALPKESNKAQLKRSVEEEYRKWKSMTNESDMVKHFTSQGTPPLFYCLLYKMLLENEPISLVAYKILDRIGVRALSVHLRTFSDFLVYEFANLVGGNHVNKSLEALNDLIWKCHVMTLDRLLLCLALRSFEGNEAQVCFFIIQLLVLKNPEFKNRVNDFVKENSPEHWKNSNYAEKQLIFQREYPEKYYFEHLQEVSSQGSQNNYLPVLFGNICLKVLPVFDIIIHRLIELPSSSLDPVVDQLLDQHGCLYKFHDQPITFLYNTLHYYESNLREKPTHKRKLVYTIINAFKDVKPRNWAVTETFMSYCQKNDEDWIPGNDYFKHIIGRLVDTLSNKSRCPFPATDYRFNEFPNVASHALYVTCVEILALPGKPADIANSIINFVFNNHKYLPREDIELWINAIALIFTSLPESYSNVINERIIELLKKSEFKSNNNLPFLVDFKKSHLHLKEYDISYIIALSHSYWNHGSIGQICSLPQFLKDKIKPIIKTEEQFMFVCYLVGPFLHRFSIERTRCVMDITIELYEMLEIIDKKCQNLNHIDTICDLLYHIKYMFTGDLVKKDIEGTIRNMRPELQKKLRFISNITIPNEDA